MVLGRPVIVATNAKLAAAYDWRSGSRAWSQKLDGPSTFGPLFVPGLLVLVTHSIYFLKPKSGKVVRRFSWKGARVNEVDCARRDVVCFLREGSLPDGATRLVRLNKDGIQFTDTFTSYVPAIRFAPATKLLYISHLHGIDVRQAKGSWCAGSNEKPSHPALRL